MSIYMRNLDIQVHRPHAPWKSMLLQQNVSAAETATSFDKQI